MIRVVEPWFHALIIFGKMYFLLISENEFFHEVKRDGITSLHGIHDRVLSCMMHIYTVLQVLSNLVLDLWDKGN